MEDLIKYYKEQAHPMFDTIFSIDDAKHQDLIKDLDYIVFYGEIATGARIVVSNRQEGQIKVRIWDPKLDHLLDGVENFFDELHVLEKRAKTLGEGDLFVSKEVEVKVLEKAEIDEVLKGTTVRLPFMQRLWKKNKDRIFIFVIALVAIIIIWGLTVSIDTSTPSNQNLVNNMRLLIPAAAAIAVNYLVQMALTISANKSFVTWALARNRNYSADV